jgi:hypothetical protein
MDDAGGGEGSSGVLLLAYRIEAGGLRVVVDAMFWRGGAFADAWFLGLVFKPQRSLSVRRCDDWVRDLVPAMMSGLSTNGRSTSSADIDSSLSSGLSPMGMKTQSTVRSAPAAVWNDFGRTLREGGRVMLSEMEGDGEYRRLAIACDLPVSPSWRGQVNTKRMYSLHFTDDVSKGPRSPSAWQGDATARLSSNSKWIEDLVSKPGAARGNIT